MPMLVRSFFGHFFQPRRRDSPPSIHTGAAAGTRKRDTSTITKNSRYNRDIHTNSIRSLPMKSIHTASDVARAGGCEEQHSLGDVLGLPRLSARLHTRQGTHVIVVLRDTSIFDFFQNRRKEVRDESV
jgi:hypothetical protein